MFCVSARVCLNLFQANSRVVFFALSPQGLGSPKPQTLNPNPKQLLTLLMPTGQPPSAPQAAARMLGQAEKRTPCSEPARDHQEIQGLGFGVWGLGLGFRM